MCFRRDKPAERHELPSGCCRFGLKINMSEKWHGFIHGTTDHNVASIVRHQSLLMPGDVLENAHKQRSPVLPRQWQMLKNNDKLDSDHCPEAANYGFAKVRASPQRGTLDI